MTSDDEDEDVVAAIEAARIASGVKNHTAAFKIPGDLAMRIIGLISKRHKAGDCKRKRKRRVIESDSESDDDDDDDDDDEDVVVLDYDNDDITSESDPENDDVEDPDSDVDLVDPEYFPTQEDTFEEYDPMEGGSANLMKAASQAAADAKIAADAATAAAKAAMEASAAATAAALAASTAAPHRPRPLPLPRAPVRTVKAGEFVVTDRESMKKATEFREGGNRTSACRGPTCLSTINISCGSGLCIRGTRDGVPCRVHPATTFSFGCKNTENGHGKKKRWHAAGPHHIPQIGWKTEFVERYNHPTQECPACGDAMWLLRIDNSFEEWYVCATCSDGDLNTLRHLSQYALPIVQIPIARF
jgi:hypothetical protein